VCQKSGAANSWPYFYQILTDLKKKSFHWKIPCLDKFAVKWILKIPPHLAYVATLPCETLMSAKQAINDKLQGTVATYLRCGELFNNKIKKSLLMSVRMNYF